MSQGFDFGHSDEGISQHVVDLMTSGTVEIDGVVYLTQSVDLVDEFTDSNLKPCYNVCVEITNHNIIEKGNYLATGTLRQCYEYLISL